MKAIDRLVAWFSPERAVRRMAARSALARLRGGAADLVSDPGAYDAAREMIEETRRAELEAQAAEEARLTDAGVRGVPSEQR